MSYEVAIASFGGDETTLVKSFIISPQRKVSSQLPVFLGRS
jgi:hypothetical protein